MKKILIPIFVLLCCFAKAQYNPSTTSVFTPLSKPIALTGKPDGARTYYTDISGFTYRFYTSTAEANSWIIGNARKGHFYVIITVGGLNLPYWWRDGIADGDLVPMIPFTSLTTTGSSGAATLTNGVLNIPQYSGTAPVTSPLSDSSTTNPASTRFVKQLIQNLRDSVTRMKVILITDSSLIVAAGTPPNADTLIIKYPVVYINDSTFTIAGHTLHITNGGGSASIYFDAATLAGDPSNPLNPLHLKPTAVTPGSYTNINGTIDSTGRFTAASNGSGGSGTDSASNAAYGIIKSNVGTTRYYKLDSATVFPQIRATIPASTLSAVLATGRTLSAKDSILLSNSIYFKGGTTKADSVLLSINGYINPVVGVDSVEAVGTSITYRLSASPYDSAFAPRTGQYYAIPTIDRGLSSSLAITAVTRHLANINPGHSALTLAELGFNDLAQNGVNGYADATNALTSIFSNQFVSSYTAGNAMTKYGTWNGPYDMTGNGGKTTNAAYSVTLNDSVVTTTAAGTVVTVALAGRPGIVSDGGTVTVFIDNVNKGTINLNNQGAANGFTPLARYFPGLSNTTHVVKLVNSVAGFLVVDYVGVLGASPKKPLVAVGIPYRNYSYTGVGNSTKVRTDTLNNRLQALVTQYAADGFPVYFANSASYYPGTFGPGGLAADSIHPSNIGHRLIFNAIIASLQTPASAGMLQSGNDGFLYYGGKKINPAPTLQNVLSSGSGLFAPNSINAHSFPLTIDSVSQMVIDTTLTISRGQVTVDGGLSVQGPSGGLYVNPRDGLSGTQFILYSQSNNARLYANGRDVIRFTPRFTSYFRSNTDLSQQNALDSAVIEIGGHTNPGDPFPIRIRGGVLRPSPLYWTIESDSTNLWWTDIAGTRTKITNQSGGGGVTTVGTVSGTSTANALDISSSTITAHYGDATNPGVMKKYTSTGTNTDGTMTQNAITNAINALSVTSGTYTPTLVATTNVTGTPTAAQATYIQVGNIVTVRISGTVVPTVTGAGTLTTFTISLPVTTATTTQVSVLDGAVTTQSSGHYYVASYGTLNSSTTVQFNYLADGTAGANQPFTASFQYKTN